MKKTINKNNDISEEWIESFVVSRLGDKHILDSRYISNTSLKYEIILKRKNDMDDVDNVIQKMNNLGLKLCVVNYPDLRDLNCDFEPSCLDHVGEYDLQKFAILRGYEIPQK